MKIVKPPTFEEIVKATKSKKRAVQHLYEAGFDVNDIERRSGLPYHLIRLYIENIEPTNPLLFDKIVHIYNRLATMKSRKGVETILAHFFKMKGLDLEKKVRLALGQVFDENPGFGPGLMERAIALATGEYEAKVQKIFIEYGEYGEVAYLLTKEKKPTLTVEEVYEALKLLPKSDKIFDKLKIVISLLKASSPEEARYIVRLILQDLKLGYHEGTVKYAAAKAFNVSPDLIEKACTILGTSDALILAYGGEELLAATKLRPGKLIKPQLAQLYESDKVIFPVRVEYKYDGSRLQLHKWGMKIWLYSRRGIEKSATLPEVKHIVKSFKAHSCIVDSEVVAVDKTGMFLPFKYLLERTVPRKLKRKEIEERMREVGLTIRVFDVLYVDGRNLMKLPLKERRKYMMEIVPKQYWAEGMDCKNEIELMKFYHEALEKGLEGVVVKSLSSTYDAGKRTSTWLKFKPERDSIDAVIVKALFGKGERAGFYSSFLLAVRDPKEKKLYTIGKVSNIPEDIMAILRREVENMRISEDKEGVFLRPKVVFEVTFQEIQETSDYTSGYSLRVPKFVRVRTDKSVEDIDSVDKVRRLFYMQYERYKDSHEIPET